MNWLDVILLLIIGASVIGSFRKGLSRQLIHLVAVIAAIVLGAWFYGRVAEYLEPHMSSPTAARLGGFLIVFFVVVFLGAMVSFTVGKFLRVTGLSIVDHLLGAVFGLLRGVLVAVALIMGVMAFSKNGKPPRAIEESRVSPYVSQAARVFAALAPHELKEGFHKSYDQARVVWHRTAKKDTHTASDAERK
ncbi:MAG: CvpA family protein [Ignavibacteriota bacterium]